MIGNNSCGIHSVMAGRTADNVESLDVALYDGTRLQVGKTSEEELEAIIRQGGRKGEIYGRLRDLRDRYADLIRERYPKIPRRVSGYNLDELLAEKGFNVARALVGTEGTCVMVLKATVNLVHNPPVRSLLVLGFGDVFAAADRVPDVLPFKPVGLEGLDSTFLDDMIRKGLHDPTVQQLPEGTGWLLCEFGGNSKRESDAPARALMEKLKQGGNPPSM
jgi:FAD/FMN-containing dehydrogenase